MSTDSLPWAKNCKRKAEGDDTGASGFVEVVINEEEKKTCVDKLTKHEKWYSMVMADYNKG